MDISSDIHFYESYSEVEKYLNLNSPFSSKKRAKVKKRKNSSLKELFNEGKII